MSAPIMTNIERRKVEAQVLIPMIQAFQRVMGKEQANAVARGVILELARKDGALWAERFGDGLPGIHRVFKLAADGGSLKTEELTKSETELRINVTRCQYAEFFKGLGLPELGYLLSCNRDFAMVESFDSKITLRRTQTIMEGASHCDFVFSRKP